MNTALLCCVLVYTGPSAISWPAPPHSQGYYITHNDAPKSVGLSGMSDGLVAETSYLTIHNTTNIPGGIRTHNLSRQAAADLRLRPHCHWGYVVFGCQK